MTLQNFNMTINLMKPIPNSCDNTNTVKGKNKNKNVVNIKIKYIIKDCFQVLIYTKKLSEVT